MSVHFRKCDKRTICVCCMKRNRNETLLWPHVGHRFGIVICRKMVEHDTDLFSIIRCQQVEKQKLSVHFSLLKMYAVFTKMPQTMYIKFNDHREARTHFNSIISHRAFIHFSAFLFQFRCVRGRQKMEFICLSKLCIRCHA